MGTSCLRDLHFTYKLLPESSLYVQTASQVFTSRTNCFTSLHFTHKLLPKPSLYIRTASQVFTLRTNCFLSLHFSYKLLSQSSLEETGSNQGRCPFSRLGICAGATKHMREGHFAIMSAARAFATYKLPPRSSLHVQTASRVFTLRTNCRQSLHFTCKLLPKSSLYAQTASQVFTLRTNCFPSLHFPYKLLPESSLYIQTAS